MSEEEKEAIIYLEFLSNEKCECEACQHAKKEYKTILNVIEKQQKEIEKYEQQIDLEFVEKNFIEKNKVVSKDKIREVLKDLEEVDEFFYNTSALKEAIKNSLNRLLEEN